MYVYACMHVYVCIFYIVYIYISAGHLDASGSMSLPIGAYVSI